MNKLIMFAVVVIILSGTVIAAPPSFISGSFQSGLFIKIPVKETFKLNKGYEFNIHVFNNSNGLPVTNVGCFMHLYNVTGDHIYSSYNNKTVNVYDFEFDVSAGNFSTVGQYYYNVQCNNSISGGFSGEYIYVTAQGVPYSTTHGVVYSALFFVLVFIFLVELFFIFSIDVDNKVSDGRVIQINYMKYLRIFLIAMCYVTFIAINYFAWNIAYGILEFEEMAKFFRVLFTITYSVMYPIFIVIIVWSIAQFVKDKKVEEFVKRNLSFK